MDLPSAAGLAQALIAQHKLARKGWTFHFNRAKRAMGMCRYGAKRIELSVHFVMNNDESAIRDTVLHEIAHALAGHKAGHGSQWIAACQQVGALPQRTSSTANMPQGAYQATCLGCRQTHHRHRAPMRGRHYFCRQCGASQGLLTFRRSIHQTLV